METDLVVRAFIPAPDYNITAAAFIIISLNTNCFHHTRDLMLNLFDG